VEDIVSQFIETIAKLAKLPDVAGGAGVTVGLFDSGVSRSDPLPTTRVTTLDHRGQPDTTTIGQHGTMCAGLIAGGPPVSCGAAPKTRLHSYLVTRVDGAPAPVRVRSALAHALESGTVDLICCSFTLNSAGPDLIGMMRRAVVSGVPVFAATNIGGAAQPFPDRIASVLIIGPTTLQGRVPPNVQLNEHVELLAPGTGLTTVRANGFKTTWKSTSSSSATALVSGFAALLLALTRDTTKRRRLGRVLPALLVATASRVPGRDDGPRLIDPIAALAATRGLLATL
jgi:subtilisin family serine protease